MKTSEDGTMLKLRSFRNMLLATVMGTLLLAAPQSKAIPTLSLPTGSELKTPTQYRTEAALYERSIRSIATITTLKLDNPEALKQALDVLERETPNLKHLPSFLVFSGINDSTFSTAVKRNTDTRSKAEILLKRLTEDPKTILEIDGARSLARRLSDRTSADSKLLRSVAERINTAIAGVDLTNHRMEFVLVIKVSAHRLGGLSVEPLLTSFRIIFQNIPGSSAIEQELRDAAHQQFLEAIQKITSCPDHVKKELESCLSKATSRVQQTRCRTRALEDQAKCFFNF